jgi:endonuclease/exonuclease/phosphatase family metal-dependent hydrolase
VRGFDADVVVLLESWREPDGRGLLDDLTNDDYRVETVEFRTMTVSTRRAHYSRPGEGMWELAICSRLPVRARRVLPIGHVQGDPAGSRSALECTIDVGGVDVDVIGVHTSSRLWELAPVRHLRALRQQLPGPGRTAVIAGDFNLWGPPVGALFPGWHRAVRGRSYPGHRPHSQIDHVLVRDDVSVVWGEVLAANPSDHRPVRVRLRVDGGRQTR